MKTFASKIRLSKITSKLKKSFSSAMRTVKKLRNLLPPLDLDLDPVPSKILDLVKQWSLVMTYGFKTFTQPLESGLGPSRNLPPFDGFDLDQRIED